MYSDTTPEQIEAAMARAYEGFLKFRHKSGKEKGAFLREVAAEIEALGVTLIQTAMQETNLPEARLMGERGRTCFQLRSMAELVEEGSWVDATIDTAAPDRQPLPKPDIRNSLVPIGPVVVFGASNFPFAYSTAGVDPASAWAAGCSVVVKAHPAHPKTSEMVAVAVKNAIKKTGIPEGTFEHVYGASFEVGKTLVMHPKTAAVGFTGSLAGGKALFDLANQRPVPIPVFSEMGSTNPVFLLPDSLLQNTEKLAKMYGGSITGSMGQFCTKPGLIFGIDSPELDGFISMLSSEITAVQPVPMLSMGIAKAFKDKRTEVLNQPEIKLVAGTSSVSNELDGIPSLASILGEAYAQNPNVHQEVFGPFALVVKCKNATELNEIATHLEGQLTCTLMATETDMIQFESLIKSVSLICGRLILNGVPTGVEVCPAMQHGGPFPASTDGRFGSVGSHAIKRFVRPLAIQNFPDAFLIPELQNANPLNIWRTVNGKMTKEAIH